jgi:hypothetical protein
VAILLAFSCKKESKILFSKDLTIGNLSSSSTFYHKTFESYLEVINQKDSIDIDNDGVFDFKFISTAENNFDIAYLICLNLNYNIAYTEYKDSLFIRFDSTENNINEYKYTRDFFAKTNNESLYMLYHGYTPNLYDSGYKIIYDSLKWSHDSEYLLSKKVINESDLITSNPQPGGSYFWIKLDLSNNMGIKYLPIMKKQGSTAYLGWIKLKIENFSSIYIYEYVFQKEL